MTKKDIIRKLCSRKMWFAVAGFVTGLLNVMKVDAQLVEEIGGLIMMGASVVAYIIGEGLADAANAKPAVPVMVWGEEEPPDDGHEIVVD